MELLSPNLNPLPDLGPTTSGPDDFNGYGYFYVRLYWTGFGLPANIVEARPVGPGILGGNRGVVAFWVTKRVPLCWKMDENGDLAN